MKRTPILNSDDGDSWVDADGKIVVVYSPVEPSYDDFPGPPLVGDAWRDTSNDNKLYTYNGYGWVAQPDTP